MSPRLGYTAFPCLLALVLLAGCGATNNIPLGSASTPSAKRPQLQNIGSYTAQLYGNETLPFQSASGPRSVLLLKRRNALKHGLQQQP
jgi:hypothetical protein